MAKPSWEKGAAAGVFTPTSTGTYANWGTIRAVSSATDAQKMKHLRIAYSLVHSAGFTRGLLELMRWPESQTPTSSEPAQQDVQVFVQRPIVGDVLAIHYGFLRWPGVVVKPGEELYLGFRGMSASTGTTTFRWQATWLETIV